MKLRTVICAVFCWLAFTAAAVGESLSDRVSLADRTAEALRLAAGDRLPAYADIAVSEMTPVRGRVEGVEILRYNPQSGYFDAVVSGGGVRKKISGRAQARASVVAPIHAVGVGESIAAEDLTLIKVPIAQLPEDALFDVSAAVGGEARRSLAANRPISGAWLGAPVVVRRNNVVTLSLENAYMTLTARGRALDDGAIGDTIRVIHVDGASVVEGVVAGRGAVVVN